MLYRHEFHLGSLALALLATAGTCAITLLAVGLLHGSPVDFAISLIYLVFSFMGSLFLATLFGLPVLFVMRPMGLVNRWSTMLVGAIIGTVTGWMTASEGFMFFNVLAWLIAGTLSPLGGWTVWMWCEQRRKQSP